jgi:hypothetical protein
MVTGEREQALEPFRTLGQTAELLRERCKETMVTEGGCR